MNKTYAVQIIEPETETVLVSQEFSSQQTAMKALSGLRERFFEPYDPSTAEPNGPVFQIVASGEPEVS